MLLKFLFFVEIPQIQNKQWNSSVWFLVKFTEKDSCSEFNLKKSWGFYVGKKLKCILLKCFYLKDNLE